MKGKQVSLFDNVYIDHFAGGGGASTGIEMATGQPVDVAINHDEMAIALHRKNHPYTKHYREDVWKVDPAEAIGGKHVRLIWFSPDCKHFSRVKGAALVDKKIRGLAWIVPKWLSKTKPDVFMLENVPEFKTWGPVKNGKKIFEGDIIFDSETKENHFVEFEEGGFCAGDMFLQAYISFGEFDSEIIGNIHDNPELLEMKE